MPGYSWSVVASLGRHCRNLMRFRLTIWSAEDIEDEEALELEEDRSAINIS